MKGTKIKLLRDLGIMIGSIVLFSVLLFQNADLLSWKSIFLMFAILVPLINALIIVKRILQINKGEKVNW
ncbi:MAG TPA: hypothetical protein VL021_04935 [Brumimicrobium sp.]|nr:hypothetical protein [Brumimicrobium sp.]